VPDPGLIEAHLRAHADGGVIGLGRLRLLQRRRWPGGVMTYFERWWREHYDLLDSGREPTFWDCFSGNLSAPTAVLREIGGFDERLVRIEDVELGLRLVKAGLPLRYVPDASAAQLYDKDFTGTLRDMDAAGTAAVALLRAHPELIHEAPLGDFANTDRRALLLRRFLLAVRAPVWPLRAFDVFGVPSGRLFRFVQLYCYWRSVRAAVDRDTWLRLSRGPIVLMYHAVAEPGEPASRYVIARRRLALQLAWVRLRRPMLTLDEYAELHESGRLAPPGAVIVTFDDGYRDNVTRALPVLRRLRVPAAFYIVSGAVGRVVDWTDEEAVVGRPLADWNEVRELLDAGMEVGSHTVTHPDMVELSPGDAERELAQSRAELERRLGRPVRHFAFPFGRTSAELRDAALRQGYRTATTVDAGLNGPAVPAQAVRRIEIRGTDSFPRFVFELWLGLP
jgi:peptidoglycan/xylan/chitin deacetylase (PgdA/CDA1 family)